MYYVCGSFVSRFSQVQLSVQFVVVILFLVFPLAFKLGLFAQFCGAVCVV